MTAWAFAFHLIAVALVAAGIFTDHGIWATLAAIFAACAIVGLVNYHRFVRQMEIRAGRVSPGASGRRHAAPTRQAPGRNTCSPE